MAVVYWKFGDVKLGKADDKPEFSDSTYFMMVFCSGVAVGLFFYGVSEPLYHLASHRYAGAGYHVDDEKAQYALDLTVYHWGLHGFVVYTLVALLLGFVSFKKGLTLTIRSCFYPLIGDRIYGWVGDVIDSFSIFTVVAGACTFSAQTRARLPARSPSFQKIEQSVRARRCMHLARSRHNSDRHWSAAAGRAGSELC